METKPYLIALDLDGTLLKDDKTISENTLHT
ncbi:HAD hydrolase family protein, partial [Staphylococcus aureus]